ncbi:MAG: cytochrome C [Telmatospirillum sp.]|nr:cytochrome C [Telmatospirillum sp.]
MILLLAGSLPARALPSFAAQTGQPCAACHVGAFGPQLTQFGRDFKLYGYVAAEPGKSHFPPISLSDQMVFTHTQKDQPPGSVFPPRFSKNDNFSPGQEVSIYYAGTIIPKELGGFIEVHYESASSTISLSNVDIRHAQEGRLFGSDMVWGVTLNDSPAVTDIWNSTPVWGFPYYSSALAPTPVADTVLGQTSTNAFGLGLYGLWRELLYLEFDLYRQLPKGANQVLGHPIANIDIADDVTPYWRAAIQHLFDNDRQYVEIGTLGLSTSIRPGGDNSTSHHDHYLDVGVDANYQWYADPNDVRAPVVSAHAIYLHEDQSLDASRILSGSNAKDHLDTFRADVSVAIDATYTPTIGYFRRTGSTDPSGHWGTDVTGNTVTNPKSAGWVWEMTYVPWGKPDSLFQHTNMRLTAQYTYYTAFNGTSTHATDNNTLMLMVHFTLGVNN